MKHLPYSATRILQKRALELYNNFNIKSMWCWYDDKNNIVIYTDGPGYWIGRKGIKLKELEESLNTIMNSQDNEFIHVRIQECEAVCYSGI